MTAVAAPRAAGRTARSLAIRPFLGCVFAIDVLAMMVVIAYGSVYLINVLEAPPSYPAYSLGVYGLVKLLAAPAGGWFLDRAPARVGVVIAFSLNLVGLGLMLAWHQALGYVIGVAFLSGGIAFSWLVVFHVLGVATEPATRARLTSAMAIVSAAATACGFAGAAARRGLAGRIPGRNRLRRDSWRPALPGGERARAARSLIHEHGTRAAQEGEQPPAQAQPVPGRLQAVAAANGSSTRPPSPEWVGSSARSCSSHSTSRSSKAASSCCRRSAWAP
jgi:hypothetical protein